MRKVGPLGEATFLYWARQANITANKANEDEFGWDFYAEFPVGENFESERFHEAPLKCKIQVKATDRCDRNLSIKLSSLSELAKDLIPSFILFMEFNKGNSPSNAFLYHIDEKLIYSVFSRIREIKLRNPNAKINKEFYNISYRNAPEMESLNGNCLQYLIQRYVPMGMINYVAKKTDYLEKCGYENGYERLNFTTETAEQVDDLIDVSLGLKENVNVSSLQSFHSRFGMVDIEPKINAGKGLLSMPDLQPTNAGFIKFRQDKLSRPLTFPCEIFLSPFYSYIPKEKWKFRVSFGYCDLVMSPYSNKVDWKFNYQKINNISLGDLKKYYDLSFLINSSDNDLTIEIDYGGGEAFVNGARCLDNLDRDLVFRNSIADAMRILSVFDVHGEFEVNFKDFVKHHKRYSETMIFFDRNEKFYKFRFELFGVDGLQDEVACINLALIPLGEVVIGFFYVIKGIPSVIDGKYEVVSNEVDIKNKMVLERKLFSYKNDLKMIAENIAQEYIGRYKIAFMFDVDSIR